MQSLVAASWREALSLARCAVAYPLGLLDVTLRSGSPSGDVVRDTPVVLVHGFAHNSSAWFLLSAALRRAGFTSIHTFNYNPFRHGVATVAERLAQRVALVQAVTGAERVHAVGHSMGGVVLRWYVQELGGDETIASAVTLASPHKGTIAAFVGAFRGAADLRPNSPVIRRLDAGARQTPVRWVAYYGDHDALVQPISSGRLDDERLRARNVLVPGMGHMGMLMARDVVTEIVEELAAAPEKAAPVELTPA